MGRFFSDPVERALKYIYYELTTGLRREAAGVKEEVGRGGGREEEAGVYLWLQNLWIWTKF